ncbi:probable pectinesterase/pectinesterase inhibitor 32 [Zingiber officinale]|uniref:probable pectinesterase/pectinesterase inhibitor 32 n=1 Tax=Zingiber officinale TaxID=94328 RepID=UPI001C4D83A2|nr:probable pectinesterase/pectinesterase inhibitor 32 [Zingiber officinale]
MVCRRAAPLYIPLFQAFFVASVVVIVNSFDLEPENVAVAIDVAHEALTRVGNWVEESYEVLRQEKDDVVIGAGLALTDCVKLYEDSERRIMQAATVGYNDNLTWLSAMLTSHQTCTKELQRCNVTMPSPVGDRTMVVLRQVLATHALHMPKSIRRAKQSRHCYGSKWISQLQHHQCGCHGSRQTSVAEEKWKTGVDMKSDTYIEDVKVNMHNIMFVGDDIDSTVVTGYRSVPDGYTPFSSATFSMTLVTGDGFWVRDMTFENMARLAKYYAAAMTVASDRSVFY